MHRISVLLDPAVKVKLFHWRRTSVIRGAAQIAGVIRDCYWSDKRPPGPPYKIRDVTQWSLYKSILPKNMAALKSDVTSAVLN